MKKLSLKEIQFEEKEILKSTIEFLDKNKIKYYVNYGTLLGAVRHKGFIPWDDDIDIVIVRDDYEKLLKIIKNNNSIKENIEFTGYEINVGKYPFLKVINKNVELKQKVNVDKYLWIDVFPLDKCPDSEKETKKFLKKQFIGQQIICLKMMKYRDVFRSSKNLKRRIIKIIVKPFVYFINFDRFLNKYISDCKKYNNTESNILGNTAGVTYMDYFSSNLLESSSYKFEDIMVNSFKDYDTILSNLYGDYMKLPPEEKRYSHSFDAYKKDE